MRESIIGLAALGILLSGAFSLASFSGTVQLHAVAKPKPVLAAAAHPKNVTIYFDNYGFDPNILHVPIGTRVNVKNISTTGSLLFEALEGQPNQNVALNLGSIAENQSKSFRVTRPGVWQYEGNDNPSIRGLIGTAANSSLTPGIYPNAKITSGNLFIKYDDYGFMPNEINVPVGTRITLKNVTDNTQPGVSTFEQSSGPPNPSLNVGPLNKQQSAAFYLTTKGSWLLSDIDQPTAKAQAQISAY